MSASCGLGSLQMVLEQKTGRCAKGGGCSPKVDTRWCANEDVGPQRGMDLVGSHID